MIGIGLTVHNRNDVFKNTLAQIKKYLPKNAVIVIVDDASKEPIKEADYRFNENVGIAKAKNKCLELLYNKGCEHLFLFDDDTYPIKENWHLPYVNSKEPHLNYIFKDFSKGNKLNDTQEIYKDSKIVAYNHTRGCMLYFKRIALDKVGGMDTVFGKWGYEHPNLSDRIFMAGLTSFRYMDVPNSNELIYSMDEHREVVTTVAGSLRQKMIATNKKLYEQRKFKDYYFPFAEKENVILTCYFTGVTDPQRNSKWNTDIDKLNPLIESLKGIKLVVFHDCFTDDIKIPNVEFIRTEATTTPYFQRWITYRQWLMQNKDKYANVFCVDATDVEVLKVPDWSNMGDNIWLGCENEIIGCQWMRNHNPERVLQHFIREYHDTQLLNAGIVGGKVEVVIEFIRQIIDLFSFHNGEIEIDMGALNYIAYTNWEYRIKTGIQVCTEFKANEYNNVSIFKHK